MIILTIQKQTYYRIFKFNLIINQIHTSFKKQLNQIIKNPKKLINANVFGPPSALIISKELKFYYDNSFIFLVDVDLYIRLLEKLNINDIFIINKNHMNIISSQNNKYSITNFLKINKHAIKLIEREKLLSIYKYDNNLIKIINSFYFFILYKSYSILNTRILIYRF